MRPENPLSVSDIEVVEDFSSTAKCDEGFLRVRRRVGFSARSSDGASDPAAYRYRPPRDESGGARCSRFPRTTSASRWPSLAASCGLGRWKSVTVGDRHRQRTRQRPVNVPGTCETARPNWRIRLDVGLEALAHYARWCTAGAVLRSAIANATGGRYFRAHDTAELAKIYDILDELEPIEVEQQSFRPTRALFYWPLSLAFLLSCLLFSGHILRTA